MGWFEDAGDNLTAFFGGTTPEKVRANKQRVKGYQDANKPLPSIQKDLGNKQALAVPNRKSNVNPAIMGPTADKARQRGVITPIERQPPRDGRNTLPPGWRERNARMAEEQAPPSPLEILLGKLSEQYQGGPDPSSMDFSALDRALESRLGALGGAREKIQGNFNTSDANLEGMHRAFENQVRTEDAARYNQISDQQKANLNSSMQATTGNLEQARAKAMAERQAMLQNLGIQEAGAAVDPGAESLNKGIQTIQERTGINQQLADQQRGTNLAYNNTVAQSIGQQGVARRSALQQQLQGLLGRVDMAESEARAQNDIERQRAISSAGDASYDQWNDNQNRMMDLFQTLSGQELQREKMGMDTGPEAKPRGMAQIAADLEMSGADPAMAQRGLAALGEILSEGNYLDGANGPEGNTPYDRVNIITQRLKAKGIDPFTASQIGISYGDM